MNINRKVATLISIVLVACNTFTYITADDLDESIETEVLEIKSNDETLIVDNTNNEFESDVLVATISEVEYEEEFETYKEELEKDETSVDSEIIATLSALVADVDDDITEIAVSNEVENNYIGISTFSEIVNNIIEVSTITEIDNNIIEISTLSEIDNNIIEISTISEIENNTIEISTISEMTFENTNIATKSEMNFVFKSGNRYVEYVPKRIKSSHLNLLKKENLPQSYDSRNVNGVSYVPPIRNQKPYGMCWAFSMIGQAETSAIKKGLVPDNNSIDLSEAALNYYMYNLQDITSSGSHNIDFPGYEGNDYTLGLYDFADMSDWANIGGNKMLASLQMSSYMGYVKENEETSFDRLIEYKDNIEDYTLDGKYAFNSNSFEVGNIEFINSRDIEVIKKAIMKNGSVGISYCFDERSESTHNIEGDYFYCSEGDIYTNHAIIVIGWDDNIAKENFYFGENYDNATYKIEEGDGAWLCRNSLGESYGNGGYFYISYYETSLRDDTFTSTEVIPSNTYEYNYHYDTTISPVSVNVNNLIGNIFKVSDDKNQSLDAINIAIDDVNTTFDVEIYTSNIQMETPVDGTKELTQKVTLDLSGIWTIPLDKKVPLKKDTYFSIVIRPEKTFSMFVDKEYVPYSRSWFACVNEAKLGQSYIYKDDTWVDYNSYDTRLQEGGNEGRNWRIKGLTNKAGTITFKSGGGVGTMSEQVTAYGEETKLNGNMFSKSGYEFICWIDSDGNKYYNRATLFFTEDMILTATWKKIKRNSSNDGGGGGVGVAFSSGFATIPAIIENVTPKPAIIQTIDSTLTIWEFDPIINKFKLNINVGGGGSLPAKNGFYIVNTIGTEIVNGIPTQVVVQNTYYFDTEGSMVTGWVKTVDSKWYFFENAKTADEGKMVTGWKQVQGSWYYFGLDGAMFQNTVTPDGFIVDENGVMVQ